jgi:SAM-dependent methyltransferase
VSGSAAAGWRAASEALAIPQHLLDAAPEPPYAFSVALFAEAADDAVERRDPTVSTRRAAEALPRSGAVLDVGCGAGAAALPLAGVAGRLIGVDQGAQMLAAFRERAAALGVEALTVEGTWPDVGDTTPLADVVVCHHVVYNVADLPAFLTALTDHARRRVVVELTAQHPLAWTVPYWRAMHGLDRPAGPTADDAVAVLREIGLHPQQERWRQRFHLAASGDHDVVAFLRRRLCLPAERDTEVAEALAAQPAPHDREVVTLWWDGAAH